MIEQLWPEKSAERRLEVRALHAPAATSPASRLGESSCALPPPPLPSPPPPLAPAYPSPSPLQHTQDVGLSSRVIRALPPQPIPPLPYPSHPQQGVHNGCRP